MAGVNDPIRQLLNHQPVAILDGGFATELEAHGISLASDLWSAALLIDDLDAVRAVHLDYLEAGADCIVSATYQATLGGFVASGLTESEAERVLVRAVDTALACRNDYWARQGHGSGRQRPLVAAGVGPYGAFLADGSEFTGDYDLDENGLVEFHRDRWHLLAAAGADLLACETIPSVVEARALVRLLGETPRIGAWLSFSCRDGARISDGTELAAIVREVHQQPGLLAIGLNCTSPLHVSSLLQRARAETDKPLVVYPNSGETWDAADRRWVDRGECFDMAAAAPEWVELGARLVGGCCRTTPDDIARVRHALIGSS